MRLTNWRAWLIMTHRWMGIALGLMLVVWTTSGIVLMYFGLPHLTAAERLSSLPELDTESVVVSPAEAAAAVGADPFRIRLSMLGDRPVYRLNTGSVFGRWTLVYADTGAIFEGFDAASALAWLERTFPASSGRATLEARLTGPDLYTNNPGLQTHMPMFRIAIDDANATKYYVSSRSGEVVLETNRLTRLLGFVGYELHTLFFFRQQRWWSAVLEWLAWSSLAMVLLGFVLGVWRLSRTPRFHRRVAPSRSPYTGLMKWHHYAGLIFGVFVVGWLFSGLVSLSVVPGIAETLYTPAQISAGARSVQGQGPRLPLEGITAAMVRSAAAAVAARFESPELELISFGGRAYWMAYRRPTPQEVDEWHSMSAFDFIAPTLDHDHRLVDALAPDAGALPRLDDGLVIAAARLAMPDAGVTESAWLTEFDDYFYPRHTSFDLGLPQAVRSLPVLRIKFDDPERTWLYLSPDQAQIVKFESTDRVNRWTYYGLHSYDIAGLFSVRPLWDALVLSLVIGGCVLSTTNLLPAIRRLRRHLSRLRSFAPRMRQRQEPASEFGVESAAPTNAGEFDGR